MVRGVLAFAGFAAAAALCGAALAGGPSPGTVNGGDGVMAPGGHVRYVTVGDDTRSAVEKISVGTGRVLEFTWLDGVFGIPLVALDGQAGGLTRDGRTLVLAAPLVYPKGPTTFAFVDTKTLKTRSTVTLHGLFSFDALSPDGKTLYLIQYLQTSDAVSYRVRAFDQGSQRLIGRVIADKREQTTTMSGSPVTRVASADGAWVYTLYANPTMPFVHALDAKHRAAVCIDLPWQGSQQGIWSTKMHLSRDGRWLMIRRSGGSNSIRVDTRTFTAKPA